MLHRAQVLICLLTLLLPVSPLCAGSSKKIFSLENLHKLALKHAETIQISKGELDKAILTREKAISVILPRLDTFGSYSSTDNRSMADPDSMTWGISCGYSFTLNGRELTALRIAEDGIDKSGLDLMNVKEEYLIQVTRAYYSILSSEKLVNISEANAARLKEHQKVVKIRLDLEDVAVTALYRANAELAKAKSVLVRAKNSHTLARRSLQNLVYLPVDFQLTQPGVPVKSLMETPLDNLVNQAMEDRSDIKSQIISESIAHKQVKWEKGAFWPTMDILGKYTYTDLSPQSLTHEENELSLGVNLTFTVYDGGLRSAVLREAYVSERQSKLALINLKKNVTLEVQEAYLDMNTKYSEISSRREEEKYSRENFNAVTLLFEEGLVESIDVMDANTSLLTAEVELARAEYGYMLAVENLKRTKGNYADNVQ